MKNNSTKNSKVLKCRRGDNLSKSKSEIIQDNLKTIEEWALQGMSEKEISECLNMAYSTFRKLKGEISALSALLKHCAKLKRDADKGQIKDVERSLFERAKGYNVEEIVPVKVKKTYFNEAGEKYVDEEVVEVSTTRHVPADIQAAKFFLVNKAKKMWQDNPHKVETDKENLQLKKKIVEKDAW